MTNEQFSEQFSTPERERFCAEVAAIPFFRKFFKVLNRPLAVHNARKENKLAANAWNRGDVKGFFAHRLTADILWAEVYGVEMWIYRD